MELEAIGVGEYDWRDFDDFRGVLKSSIYESVRLNKRYYKCRGKKRAETKY